METKTEVERLDSFSKILLATQSINYMANIINKTCQELKSLSLHDETAKELIEEQTALLGDTVDELTVIMNKLGNYMNATDCISPIDTKITDAAFEIIMRGKDEME